MIGTILVGIVAALFYAEAIGLLPGGIIVPAYLALYLDQPLRVGATVAAALLALLSFRLLSRYFVLFGRRRFVLLILLGGLFGQLWLILWPRFFSSSLDLRVIGWIIPGLLANNCQRQKVLPTLASMITVSVLTYFIAGIVALF
jgi:poly-gamma-glutamate biosynthesis protein PgsC/CapC